MLFILDDSLIENFQDPGLLQEAQGSIHRIIDSWSRGDHLVTANYLLTNFLLQNHLVYDVDIPYLKRLKNKINIQGDLENFPTHILVSKGQNVWRVIQNDDNLQLQLSPDIIERSHITDQALLVVENITEAYFFERIVESVIFERKDHLHASYVPCPGGGNTTHQVFSNYQINKDRICYCIVDSDKKYPGDSLGDTAREVVRANTRNLRSDPNAVISKYRILESHEVENLIPPAILSNATTNDPQKEFFVNWLIEKSTEENKAYLFVDIKKGLSMRNIALRNDAALFGYCSSIIPGELHDCLFLKSNQCRETCANCFEFPGMGDHVMEASIEVMKSMSVQKVNEASRGKREVYEIWKDLANRLVYWICGSDIRYI